MSTGRTHEHAPHLRLQMREMLHCRAHRRHVVQRASTRDRPLRPHVDGQAKVCPPCQLSQVTSNSLLSFLPEPKSQAMHTLPGHHWELSCETVRSRTCHLDNLVRCQQDVLRLHTSRGVSACPEQNGMQKTTYALTAKCAP